MNEHEFPHLKKRRVAKAAPTSSEAIRKQIDIAAADSHIMYAATVALHPLKVVKPVFEKSIITSQALSKDSLLPPETVIAISVSTQNLRKALERCDAEHESIMNKLQKSMQKTRLAEFQNDFAVPQNITRVASIEECMLCNKPTRVFSFDCCANTKRACMPCIRKAAFYSSQQGTKNEACCPFCRATFAVYKDRKRKCDLLESDESSQDESK